LDAITQGFNWSLCLTIVSKTFGEQIAKPAIDLVGFLYSTGRQMDFQGNSDNSYSQGQGILEFALVLPLLFLVVFGVLDLGRIFFATIGLTNAAREGVRYLTLHPDDISNDLGSFLGSKAAATDEANYAGLAVSGSQVTVTCSNTDGDEFCDSGTPATVTVTYNFDLILGWFLPSPITIARSAVMIVP
jgi:hypothetical protein